MKSQTVATGGMRETRLLEQILFVSRLTVVQLLRDGRPEPTFVRVGLCGDARQMVN